MAVRPLPPQLAKYAKDEFGESPEKIAQDLQTLKDWISKQPHLSNNIREDDQWLISFIRGCKYSLEKAKKKIERYNINKAMMSEFNTKNDSQRPEIQQLLTTGHFIPICSKEDSVQPEMIIYRLNPLTNVKLIIEDVFRVNHMIGTILLMEQDNISISGAICIIDMSGNVSDLLHLFTPANIKKIVSLTENAWPVRNIAVHVINLPPGWDAIVHFFKNFMNEKMKERIHFHKDVSNLQQHISKSILPNEYGGTAGSIQEWIDTWKNKVNSYRDYLIEDMQYRADETKIPSKSDLLDPSLYGVEGTFRKLELD